MNLASRLTEVAQPGTVLVSVAVRDVLVDRSGFAWRRHPRRALRGMDAHDVYEVTRVDGAATGGGA